MLADIVLDTNVLLHAENPVEGRYQVSRDLLMELHSCTTHLCVDEGFDLVEANNRSHIGSEYLKHLRFGMLGFAIVSHLAASSRVRLVSRQVPPNVARQIRTQVPAGTDRTFLLVAYNSQEKTLVCHDFNDVPNTVRARLRRSTALEIVDAEQGLAALR